MNKYVKIIFGCSVGVIGILFILVLISHRVQDTPLPTETTNTQTDAGVSGTRTSASLTVDGRTRDYFIYLPTSYERDTPMPLMLLLHGGGGDDGAERLMAGTGMQQKAEEEGFILAVPLGVNGNWNDGRGTTNRSATASTVTDVDDVAFLKALITELQNTYVIDSKRIFAAGVSNGSMMAQRLACDAPNLLKGVGAVAGPQLAFTTDTCRGTVSIVSINGTDDPFYPMLDSDGIPDFPRILARTAKQTVVSVDEISQLWVTKNGCASTPTTTPLLALVNDGTSVTKYTYEDCNNNHQVTYYIVTGMGHTWPPNESPAAALAGPTSENINATDVLWDFFAAL